MKFIQIDIHQFCELHITNLNSKLCAGSCSNALTIPYPELSEMDQNLNSKSSFCLLGTFFCVGSYILEKFRKRVEKSRDDLFKIYLKFQQISLTIFPNFFTFSSKFFPTFSDNFFEILPTILF